ncbi:hypothetical protein HY227_02360 [Candidatus Wolfebacteria bacterium]|nr:hypothetical protein [Candidatus Wolfebacteria bacterium]
MKDPYSWIQGQLEIEITDGRMIAQTVKKVGRKIPRPRTFQDAFSDFTHPQAAAEHYHEIYLKLLNRIPGHYDYLGFMGGATAILVESNKLRRLPEPLMDKLADWYGGPWGDITYLAQVRTTGANSIRNCAEPCGGMAGDFDLQAEMMGECIELGVYNWKGWVRFILPDHLTHCQAKLDSEQQAWWKVVRQDFPCAHEARLEFLNIGRDELDGRKGIISPGHVSEFSLVAWAQLELPDAEDEWLLTDLEVRPGKPNTRESEWVPLNRTTVGITTRGEGKAPIAYIFNRDGGVDESALHVVLEGENRDRALSHLSIPALRALGWLK